MDSIRIGLKADLVKTFTIINNNNIKYSERPNPIFPNAPSGVGRGIDITECYNTNIISNYIEDTYNGTMFPSTFGTAILAETCSSSVIKSNKFVGAKKGLVFTQNYSNIEIECNRFEFCETGVWFNGTVSASSNPLQIGSPAQSSDNVWTLGTIPVEIEGTSWNNTGVNIDWYVRDITGFPEYDPNQTPLTPINLGGGNLNLIYNTPINTTCFPPARKGLIIKNEYQVYPNPAQDYFVLELDNVEGEEIFILYDIQGEKVLQNTVIPNVNRFDISHLPSGLYNYTLDIGIIQKFGKITIIK